MKLILLSTCVFALGNAVTMGWGTELRTKRAEVNVFGDCDLTGPIPSCANGCNKADCTAHPGATCWLNQCNCRVEWRAADGLTVLRDCPDLRLKSAA